MAIAFQVHEAYVPAAGEASIGLPVRFFPCPLENGRIKFWIRNLVKNRHSFSLAVIDRNFYPDFVCVLPDDRILVVEYKGKNMWDTPKVREDREIGKLWAELSGGLCEFVMVTEKYWDSIKEIIDKKR